MFGRKEEPIAVSLCYLVHLSFHNIYREEERTREQRGYSSATFSYVVIEEAVSSPENRSLHLIRSIKSNRARSNGDWGQTMLAGTSMYKHGAFLHYSYYRRRLTRLQPECLLHSVKQLERFVTFRRPPQRIQPRHWRPRAVRHLLVLLARTNHLMHEQTQALGLGIRLFRRQRAGSSSSPASFREQQPCQLSLSIS
ncbi:uncharacterized protein TrAFT101_004896 [Trichoderma asperellum]|uniref:uncharacterized protein n=1 Tax=Trichoderma asperellum TaxID=101201 RepID=UPI00332A3FB6|nr:hypothetical protein TrAFT101_004896 [Trichoderma asperellum]